MKTILLALAILLAGCDLDALDTHSPSGYAPSVAVPSQAKMPVGEAPEIPACEQPHPEHCQAGYIRSIAPDVTTVICEHLQGCAYSSNPCTHGAPLGDPRVLVLCE